MENTTQEIYVDIEKAIDYAFQGKFVLKFYDYLKVRGTKKYEVKDFSETPIAKEIIDLIKDMDDYIEGGSDEMHKQLREGYGYISKPQARKIRNYLNEILEDAVRYCNVRGTTRKRKKVSK